LYSFVTGDYLAIRVANPERWGALIGCLQRVAEFVRELLSYAEESIPRGRVERVGCV
jgi:hypothetical protein